MVVEILIPILLALFIGSIIVFVTDYESERSLRKIKGDKGHG